MVSLSSAPSLSASTLTFGGYGSATKIGVTIRGKTLLSFLIPMNIISSYVSLHRSIGSTITYQQNVKDTYDKLLIYYL